jgi:hypothetical protein
MTNRGLPAPPVFHSGWSPLTILIVWGIPVLVVVGCAVYLAVRNRDVLPVAACVGALVCALNEPIYDTLGKLVYAQTPSKYVAYSAFGRHIPLWLVLGYIPWVAFVPYLLSRQMASGKLTKRRIYVLAAVLSASVGAVELLNSVGGMHAWRYYAPESGRGVIAGGLIQMAAEPFVCAFLFWAFAYRFKGIRRAALGVVLPAVTLPITFAATSWPLYLSNYANVSEFVRWIAAIASAGLCVLAVMAVAALVEGWRGSAAAARLDRASSEPAAGADAASIVAERVPLGSSTPVVAGGR